MKKTILLSAIISAALLTAGTVNAQGYNGGYTAYNRSNTGYTRGNVYQQGAYNYNGAVAQRSDKYRDLDRIDGLKIEMKEEARCGNWAAYNEHNAELQQLYRDVDQDRYEEKRQSEIWHAEHDYRDGQTYGYRERDNDRRNSY